MQKMTDTTAPVKVFVSYAHKDDKAGVDRLVAWLNKQEGIEVISDHRHVDVPPLQGWQAWMLHSIEDSDVVLCICGENYKKACEERGGPGTTWEGAAINADLYQACGLNSKFYPILPEAGRYDVVPWFLRPWDNSIALAEHGRILRLIKYRQTVETPGLGDNKPIPKTDTLCPVFRDLERESLAGPAPFSSVFLRLRFVERAIDYVPLGEVWKALEGFCTSSDPFSWWMIIGGAGSGKSRTALEFCEFLRGGKQGWKLWKTQWDTGFVDLEKTPSWSWQTWRPEQNTLLVIDYVARECSGNPSSVSKIFTTLTWRAKNNDLGGKRLRILLLEREYKERNETGQSLEWYRQLDKINLYQRPFDLDVVSDEGLYHIATQAAARIWESPNPLPPEPVFLDELKKLDMKKRPLFAILLAGYCAKVNPKAEITPNEVLDYIIKHELERYLILVGVEENSVLLSALILSTCTDGKLGVCRLPDNHPLWNSGLGKADSRNHFLFYPIEPDLLGERFVLNCDNRNNPFHIDREELKELLRRGWRDAPEETAHFFIRCAQDFALSDSEKITDLFLSAMSTIKEDPLNRSQAAWSFALVDLVASLKLADGRKIWLAASELGDTQAFALRHAEMTIRKRIETDGQKLFKDMAKLGDTPEIILERAKVAFSLVNEHCETGNLPEARKLFDAMTTFGETPEINEVRAKAASNLILAYCYAGNLPEAQALLDAMTTLGDTPEFMLLRAQASVNLILGYCYARNIPEARALFDTMDILGNTPKIMLERAKASFNLIVNYSNAKNLPEAQALFDAMATLGDTPEIMLLRAKASFNLIIEYINAKNLPEAQALFDAMTTLGDTPEIMLLRAKVSVNLINRYSEARNLPEARELFDAMTTLGDTPEFMLERAKASVNLINGYSEARNLPEARALFDAMATLGDTPEIARCRTKAAVNLINAYSNTENFQEALKLLNVVAELGIARPHTNFMREVTNNE